MNFLFRIVGGLCFLNLFSAVTVSAAPDAVPVLAFRFETNQPLIYEFEVKTSSSMNMTVGTGVENVGHTTKTDVRYKARLTGLGESNGIAMVSYKPYDLAGDWDNANRGGHFISIMRDMQVKGTQNGITLFDTSRGIGLSQAKKFKNDMLPFFLSGQIAIDPAGNIKSFYGDLPFIDFWTEKMKTEPTFFAITLPVKPVNVGDDWSDILSVPEVGSVKLEGTGLVCTNVYTRGTNDIVNGRPVVTINLAAANEIEDLNGYMEMPGQNTTIDVHKFELQKSGVYHFDPKRGMLIDGSVTGTTKMEITSLIQGKSTTAQSYLQIEIRITLLTP